jgi:hypothetical protein
MQWLTQFSVAEVAYMYEYGIIDRATYEHALDYLIQFGRDRGAF